MTAQVHDTILIDNKEYSIAGIDGNELFDPLDWGLFPVQVSTNCWRGYVCHYAVKDNRLVLEKLDVSLGSFEDTETGRTFIRQTGPALNGLNPKVPSEEFKSYLNVYEDLNLDLSFTGNLLAGDDFIYELYVHMGFQPAWKFRTVLEIIADNGDVLEIRDAGADMEQIRNKMTGSE